MRETHLKPGTSLTRYTGDSNSQEIFHVLCYIFAPFQLGGKILEIICLATVDT